MLSIALGPVALPVPPLLLLVVVWAPATRHPCPRRYSARWTAALRGNCAWLPPGARLGQDVGPSGLPTTLFCDAQGPFVDAHFGVLNAVALETRLRASR